MAKTKQTKKTTTAKKITRPKKPATRKAQTTKAKRATAKKTSALAKKPSAKKPAAKKAGAAKAKTNTTRRPVIAKFPTDTSNRLAVRRPPNNPEIPMEYIADMEESFTSWRDELEDFSAHLRSLDRKRLNGVGIRKLGFIGRALELAAENPEFLPHWLPLKKFQDDNNYFLALRSVFDITRQIQEILWNIVLEASDVLYTDALEYYAQVNDAQKRRIDPAETLHNDLFKFFKRGSYKGEGGIDEAEPTDKQLKRDFDSLMKGRKNGKLLIENEMPKTQGGKRKVIDETFKDTARFKGTVEGDIEE